MIYKPRYNEARWKRLHGRSGPMRNVIKCNKALVLYLPPSSLGISKEACPSYNIKGLYNAQCGKAKDHHLYPSRGGGDLMEWDSKSIPGGRTEGGGGE